MPWQDQMQVEVVVEIEDEPTDAQLAAVRYDASRMMRGAPSDGPVRFFR